MIPLYLVIVNKSFGGAQLGDRLTGLAAADPNCRFHFVVPVTRPVQGWTYTDAQAVQEATDRLALMLEFSHRLGLNATGEVQGNAAGGDPVTAAKAALRVYDAQAVILSTFPVGLSRWLAQGALNRLRASVDIPVEHIIGVPPSTDTAQARIGFDQWQASRGYASV